MTPDSKFTVDPTGAESTMFPWPSEDRNGVDGPVYGTDIGRAAISGGSGFR
jgi:hypothetical protein